MCNCIEKHEKLVREHLEKSIPNLSKIGYVLIPATMQGVRRVGISASTCVYKTIGKAGSIKPVEGTTTLLASYCPFCGEKYETEAAATKKPNFIEIVVFEDKIVSEIDLQDSKGYEFVREISRTALKGDPDPNSLYAGNFVKVKLMFKLKQPEAASAVAG